MFLGIDIGTSAVKLSLMTPDLQQIAEAQAQLTTSSPHPYWSEQDPEDWFTALCTACRDLGTRSHLSAVQAIGLSGQMHGAVLLDKAGAVIRPAILWNDGRSHAECAALAASVPDIAMISGVPPMPGFTAPKLLWLATHEPDAHRRIAHILLPKDYVGWRLHGAPVTDPSDAAGTSWLDQVNRAWSLPLAAASRIDPAWLPSLANGTDIAGTLRPAAAAALGLPRGIPIAAGGGDAATGAVGIGAVRGGAAFLSLGTSGQLFIATDSYRPNPAQMVHAYCHTVPGLWFQMAAMLNGARPLAWFAGITGQRVDALLAEADAADPETAPLFLPYLTGERSPHADAHIRGGFYGLADDTDRAAMARGIVNAVAFSFADAADSLRAAGTCPRDLLAIGGGAQSDLVLQTLATVLGTPVRRSADPTTGPALGAAKLAAVAARAATLDDLARPPDTAKTFVPGDPAPYLAGLAGYRALYRRLKGIHRDTAAEETP